MGNVLHAEPFHDITPEKAVCTHWDAFALVAEQAGASVRKAGFDKRPDPGMNRNDPAFPCCGLCAAPHGSCFQVDVRRGERQKLRNAPAAVQENQHRIDPRLCLVLPKPRNFLWRKWGTARRRRCCGGQQVGVLPGDDIQLKGELVQVHP